MKPFKAILTSFLLVLILAFGVVTSIGCGGGGGGGATMGTILGLIDPLIGGTVYNLSVVTAGASSWTFYWTSTNAMDVFGTPTNFSTTYTPGVVAADTSVTVIVTGTPSGGGPIVQQQTVTISGVTLGDIQGLPNNVDGNMPYSISVAPTSGTTAGWTFAWTSDHMHDVFSTPAMASTTYTPSREIDDWFVWVTVVGTPPGGSAITRQQEVMILPGPDCDLDPENDAALGCPVIPGFGFNCTGTVDSAVGADNDDWFRYEFGTVQPPNTLVVELTNLSPATLDADIMVYHESDLVTALDSSLNMPGLDEAINYAFPAGQTGWYYVRVQCVADAGQYDIYVNDLP